MPKSIEFKPRKNKNHRGQPTYEIVNKKAGTILGQAFYYPPWQQWVTQMDKFAVWSEDCLADVREFLVGMNNGLQP